jgi:predicted RNase H-like HicB family nuclease
VSDGLLIDPQTEFEQASKGRLNRAPRPVVNQPTAPNGSPVISAGTSVRPHEAVQPPVEEDSFSGWPLGFLRRYGEAAARHGTASEVEPGLWIARVVGLDGAWSEGATREEAEGGLAEVILDWVIVKLRLGATDIPEIDGLDIKPL